MKIERQKLNNGEWVSFLDDMTSDEEREYYQGQIDEINIDILELSNQKKVLQETIELGISDEGDEVRLSDIIIKITEKAVERKTLYEKIKLI